MERPDLEPFLAETSRAVAEALDVELVHITEHLGEGRARVRAGAGWPDGFVGTEFEMASLRVDGRNVYSNGPVVIEDLRSDSEWRARPLRDHGVISSVNVMIGHPDEPLGVLSANTRTLRTFADTDLDFLQAVAHMLAAAIERRRARGADAPRRAARRAHRPAQPHAAARPAGPRARPRGARRRAASPSCSSTSTTSRSSTTRSATARATSCCARSARACAASCAPSDTVARFGGDEFAVALRGRRRRASTRAASPSGSCARSRTRSPSAARRASAGQRRHRGRRRRRRRARRGAALATPTPRCTAPRSAAAAACELFDAGLRDAHHRAPADRGRPAPRARGRGACRSPTSPSTACRAGDVAGVEALVRWDHPERGIVPPARLHPGRRGERPDRRRSASACCAPLRAGRPLAARDRPPRPAADRQRLRAPDGRARTSSTTVAGGPRRHRPAPALARPGDHRGPAARGDAGHGADDRAAAGARHPPRCSTTSAPATRRCATCSAIRSTA